MSPKKIIILPTKDSLLQAMGVAASSIEAAEYLANRFKTLLASAGKLTEGAELKQIVESYRLNVRFALERKKSDVWKGLGSEQSEYINMHNNIANEALETLKELYGADEPDFVLHCAVDDDAKYVRGLGRG